MKSLQEYLNSLIDTNIPILEGLDIDYNNKTVSFTDKHENDMDTSLQNNPSKETFMGVEVWSLFKRTNKTVSQDGNPLIYVLKGNEYGWIWGKDKEQFYKRLNDIMGKFASSHKDVVITVPFSRPLNKELARLYQKFDKDAIIQYDTLMKVSNEEVLDWFIQNNKVKSYFGNRMRDVTYELDQYMLKSQRKHKDDIFRIHEIVNPEIRNQIKYILKINPNYEIDFCDKDILIIDDVISRGASIRTTVQTLKNYSPHSITVLTLASRQK